MACFYLYIGALQVCDDDDDANNDIYKNTEIHTPCPRQ